MKNKLRELYTSTSLATKIMYSYMVILLPIFVLVLFCFWNLWTGNKRYSSMLDSIATASEFSLDFKKDYDYETYLLIVENKTIEESELQNMLDDEDRIVLELEKITDSKDNLNRLNSVKKYLDNLEIYNNRIQRNLIDGNKYQENLAIWENDVQIVTTLISDTIYQYIYYEIKDIQLARENHQKKFEAIISFTVLAFFIITLLIGVMSYLIPKSITNPIRRLSDITDQVAKGNLQVRADVRTGVEVKVLNDSLNTMIDKINELLEQVKHEQIRLRKAEFQILQAQINPHFLYNTLGTIVWLAEAGEQKMVVEMVENLSDFFRTSLNQGKDLVTIKEEIQHIKSYLSIQQVRYQDILEYEINIDEAVYDYMIPKITLQPLIENALYHGIKNKRGKGKIVVASSMKEEYFIIKVRDDGIGMDENRLRQVCYGIQHKIPKESEIYGLYNVNERIALNFSEEYGLEIKSRQGMGTEVEVRLPYVNNTGATND